MENREKLVELYLIYGRLLTNNERSYFEYYYYEDYSLTEIADNHKVSKANVSKVLINVSSKLYEYEEKLKIKEKNTRIKSIISETKNEELISKIDEIL